jgi:Ca-activated chloride channel family protein
MTFANPYMLLLAIPVIAALFLGRRVQQDGNAALDLPMEKTFAPRMSPLAAIAASLPFMLRAVALLLIVVALARPQYVNRTELPPTEGVDIMICIDASGSMAALDFDPLNRMEAAKRNAKDFISKRPGDRIGIVVFGADALLQCPLTLDHDALLEYLDQVQIGITNADATAIGDAIATATNHLKNSQAKSKIIVLLTDGRNNSGVISDPLLAAKAAAAYGIKIYTIGCAIKGPSKAPVQGPMGLQYVPVEEDLDEDALGAISQATGGEFYRATTYTELKNIYDRIDKLEKTKFKNAVALSYYDRYSVFLVPAVLLLLAEFLLSKLVFVRIP